MEKYSNLVLRLGLGFVFIWFGYTVLTSPDNWLRLVPEWTGFIDANTLLMIHGIFELVLGLLLVLGLWIRVVASLLALSLLNTLFAVSGPTLIRDIGLFAGLVSLILNPRK